MADKMKQYPWGLQQAHSEAVNALGPDEGVHRQADGFVFKYEGAKVLAALASMGHSAMTWEKCRCNPANVKDA